jgi:hypothetical protein
MVDTKLVMPAKYAQLDPDEMVYTDGGNGYGWRCQIFAEVLGLSAAVGLLLQIPAAVCSSNIKSIEQTMEDGTYDETISYLKTDTGANQMLAEYEGTASYRASSEYNRLETRYKKNVAIRSACRAASAVLMGIGVVGGAGLYIYVNRMTPLARYYGAKTVE